MTKFFSQLSQIPFVEDGQKYILNSDNIEPLLVDAPMTCPTGRYQLVEENKNQVLLQRLTDVDNTGDPSVLAMCAGEVMNQSRIKLIPNQQIGPMVIRESDTSQ
jgi:hypothetical protein